MHISIKVARVILLLSLSLVGKIRGALLDESQACSSNATCSNEIKHSYCPSPPDCQYNPFCGYIPVGSHSCACEPGYFPSDDKKRCIEPSVLIGDKCEETLQCVSRFKSVCLPGAKACECVQGYIQSYDLTACLQILTSLDNEECSEDAQCQLGRPGMLSICTRKNDATEAKVCRCNAEAVDDSLNGVCMPKAKHISDPCSFQAQCTTGIKFSRCWTGICQCNPGYDAAGNRSVCVKR